MLFKVTLRMLDVYTGIVANCMPSHHPLIPLFHPPHIACTPASYSDSIIKPMLSLTSRPTVHIHREAYEAKIAKMKLVPPPPPPPPAAESPLPSEAKEGLPESQVLIEPSPRHARTASPASTSIPDSFPTEVGGAGWVGPGGRVCRASCASGQRWVWSVVPLEKAV